MPDGTDDGVSVGVLSLHNSKETKAMLNVDHRPVVHPRERVERVPAVTEGRGDVRHTPCPLPGQSRVTEGVVVRVQCVRGYLDRLEQTSPRGRRGRHRHLLAEDRGDESLEEVRGRLEGQFAVGLDETAQVVVGAERRMRV